MVHRVMVIMLPNIVSYDEIITQCPLRTKAETETPGMTPDICVHAE